MKRGIEDMDLSGFCGCQDGVQLTKTLHNSGTNIVHKNCSSIVWNEMESQGNDYTLQTQKTETNVTNEKSASLFPADELAQLDCQLSFHSPASKTAMDLSFHNNRNDNSKTIFEDADYFAKNHMYKLMPITFEAINETIIHIEHNYCNFGSSADASIDGNINNTVHNEADERYYKKRKTKSGEGLFSSDLEVEEESAANVSLREEFVTNPKLEEEYTMAIQPLDLSLSVFHEQKTDKMLKENQSNIPRMRAESRSTPDPKQFDLCESNKENVTSPRKIEVTISRPGQKEYYEPCEVFLNDVARISPDLVKNDCYEIDIIDRTGQDLHKEMCRTYYIVSESTWQIFENSTERIILTNDLNIGKPIQNKEKFDKPTYLIFDQHSLTESLVKICEKKGGKFEYTCLKGSTPKVQDARREVQDCASELAVNRVTLEEESNLDTSKRHLTETNYPKNLLLREKLEVESEPDSEVALKVAEKPEEEEEEERNVEEVCDISRTTHADEQTEPQVPTKEEDVIGEGDQNGEPELDKERDEGAATVETDSQKGRASNSHAGKKRKVSVAGARVKKRKIGVDESHLKRVTRSSVSLTEVETKKGRKRKSTNKVESTVNKERGLTNIPETKEDAKESSSKKSDGEGKNKRRKRNETDIGMRNGGNMRETRSTAKKKAVETRRTRGRKEKIEPEKKSSRWR